MTYLLNTNTGKVHRLVDGRSHEGCNVDAIRKAGNASEISEIAALAFSKHHCKRCWKEATP